MRAVDRRYDIPLLRITAGAKAGTRRSIPIPSPTIERIDRYLADRQERAANERTLEARPTRRLFVRHDSTPLNQQFIDTLLRRLCATAGIDMPVGAMTHALRHHYGTQLALRNVPVPVFQQLLGHADPARRPSTPAPPKPNSP